MVETAFEGWTQIGQADWDPGKRNGKRKPARTVDKKANEGAETKQIWTSEPEKLWSIADDCQDWRGGMAGSIEI